MSVHREHPTMKFGFIAHPTSIGLQRQVKIIDLLHRTLA